MNLKDVVLRERSQGGRGQLHRDTRQAEASWSQRQDGGWARGQWGRGWGAGVSWGQGVALIDEKGSGGLTTL